MPKYYHNSRPNIHRNAENFHRQHVVRSDTFKGGWAGVYDVDKHGTATLWSRRTRYEPLSVVRARVNASLGGRRKAA